MPGILPVTSLEKTNLEAHVDLCAERYDRLDERLSDLESKVDTIHRDVLEGQKSLVKVVIGTAGTIVAGLLSVAIAILTKT